MNLSQAAGEAATGPLTWRDIAAIWGAGLSTLLALGALLPSRPRFEIEPGEPPSSDLTLRISNPSTRHRLVRDVWRANLAGSSHSLGLYTRQTRLIDAGIAGSLNLLVRSGEEKVVQINCVEDRAGSCGRWLILFIWRGNWLLPVGFPVLVYVSTRRAAKLNSAK